MNARTTITVTTSNPQTCAGTGSATIKITSPSGNYDVDLDGDGIYEASHAGSTTNGSGEIIISNLPVGSLVKNVKVKPVNSNCQSAVYSINETITSPGNPDNSTDISPMCADGSSIRTLKSSTPGGIWSLDPSSTANGVVDNTAQTYTVGTSAGSAIIVYTFNGCSSQKNITITAKPTTTATSSGSLCEGDDLSLLSKAGVGTVAYNWTGPDGFTSTAQNPVILAAGVSNSGTYSVRLTENGCTSASASLSININPRPVVSAGSNSPVCEGTDLNLISNTNNSTSSYSWAGPNGFNSSVQNPKISAAPVSASGDYSVTITENGCKSLSGLISVVINSKPDITVTVNNPQTCTGTGSATITLRTYSGNYDVDLDGDGIFEETYLRSVPNGAGEIVIANLQSGTVVKNVVLRAVLSGCQSLPNNINQTIAAPGTPDNSTDNTPMCADGVSTRLLSSTSPGGVWSLDPISTSGVGAVDNANFKFTVGNSEGIAIIVYTLNGCSAKKNITVSKNSTGTVATSNGPFCEGSSLLLNASGPETSAYTWKGPNGFSSTMQNPVLITTTIANAGDYTVAIADNGCGSSVSTTKLVVYKIPVTTAASNNPLCQVGTLKLTASGASTASYKWTGPNGFKSTLQNPSLIGVSTSSKGKYTVIATENGCVSRTSYVMVAVNDLPEISVSVVGSCGENGSATIKLEEPLGSYNVDLNGDGSYEPSYKNLRADSSGKIIISNLSAGAIVKDVRVYSVTTGCESSPDPVDTIIAKNGFVSPPIAKDTSLCKGQSASELDAVASQGGILNWYNASGTLLSVPPVPPTAEFGVTTYQVSQTLNGCESQKVMLKVTVAPIEINAGTNKLINAGEEVELTATSGGDYLYNWSPSNSLDDHTKLNPMASPKMPTKYILTALNRSGCIGTSEVMVSIRGMENNAELPPNAFSPNGDGLNDKWVIDGLENYPNASLSVFDRWGGVVIQIKNYKEGKEWDGKINGHPVPLATYYYILDKGDGKKPMQGSITIER